MKRILPLLAGFALLAGASTANAQFLREQSKLVGPVVALNFLGSNTFSFGVNGEYLNRRDMGLGIVFRYFVYDAMTYQDGGTYRFTGLLFAAQWNYHFKVPQPELDPFAGMSAGYTVFSGGYHNTTYTQGNPPSSNANFVFDIQAGVRYFVTDQLGVTGRLVFGAGYNALEAGADISL